MKRFDRLLIVIPVVFLVFIVILDFIMVRKKDSGRQYLVDASRIEKRLNAGEIPSADDYPCVTGIYQYDGSPDFFSTGSKYVIREANGKLYRLEYKEDDDTDIKTVVKADAVLIMLLAVIMAVLIYIRQNILRQFIKLNDVPYQLAKGNLTEPLKESKSRFFGKFVWGLDMLRGELEQSKVNELERARKEKTLLLSLSHDIKTPLSAIKLYSKALSKGLFTEKERQSEAADNIGSKADEIESYVNEIINNLNNDFMSFDVENREFYMSDVINKIEAYYTDKLSVTGTGFVKNSFTDCMLSGDPDRLEEVLQNIFENAIKYGDGKKIELNFSDEEDCRLITVSNSGSELPEQELDHIFESFWRGSNTSNKQGSGLGLYICSRLMKEMGGDIFADQSEGTMRVTVVCRKCS